MSTNEFSILINKKPQDGTTQNNPFARGTAGSNSFRIPVLVTLKDGTLVAAADVRWNTTYDGGGLDTMVSTSNDNGKNWHYTFANYLGDNGDCYNGSASTCFIDPAIATDGTVLYMLCDLYPYGIALNGRGNTHPSTALGFNDDGKLLLRETNSTTYDYYLDGTMIKHKDGTVVLDYTVDAFRGLYNNLHFKKLVQKQRMEGIVKPVRLDFDSKVGDGSYRQFCDTLDKIEVCGPIFWERQMYEEKVKTFIKKYNSSSN